MTEAGFLIPYGMAKLSEGFSETEARADLAAGRQGRAVLVHPGVPLRISNHPFVFPEPPNLIEIATTAARLDVLRENLKSYFDVWEAPPKAFLDAYSLYVLRSALAATDIDALAAAHGGLFTREDWSYSGFAPVPKAHLHAPPEGGEPGPSPANRVMVDFAFWTGKDFVAVYLASMAVRRVVRQRDIARLQAAGITVAELDAAVLPDPDRFAAALPDELGSFWEGVSLPASPLRISALDRLAG